MADRSHWTQLPGEHISPLHTTVGTTGATGVTGTTGTNITAPIDPTSTTPPSVATTTTNSTHHIDSTGLAIPQTVSTFSVPSTNPTGLNESTSSIIWPITEALTATGASFYTSASSNSIATKTRSTLGNNNGTTTHTLSPTTMRATHYTTHTSLPMRNTNTTSAIVEYQDGQSSRMIFNNEPQAQIERFARIDAVEEAESHPTTQVSHIQSWAVDSSINRSIQNYRTDNMQVYNTEHHPAHSSNWAHLHVTGASMHSSEEIDCHAMSDPDTTTGMDTIIADTTSTTSEPAISTVVGNEDFVGTSGDGNDVSTPPTRFRPQGGSVSVLGRSSRARMRATALPRMNRAGGVERGVRPHRGMYHESQASDRMYRSIDRRRLRGPSHSASSRAGVTTTMSEGESDYIRSDHQHIQYRDNIMASARTGNSGSSSSINTPPVTGYNYDSVYNKGHRHYHDDDRTGGSDNNGRDHWASAERMHQPHTGQDLPPMQAIPINTAMTVEDTTAIEAPTSAVPIRTRMHHRLAASTKASGSSNNLVHTRYSSTPDLHFIQSDAIWFNQSALHALYHKSRYVLSIVADALMRQQQQSIPQHPQRAINASIHTFTTNKEASGLDIHELDIKLHEIAARIKQLIQKHADKIPLRQFLQYASTVRYILYYDDQITRLAKKLQPPTALLDQYNIKSSLDRDEVTHIQQLYHIKNILEIQTQCIDTLVDIEQALQTRLEEFPESARSEIESFLISTRYGIIHRIGRSLAPSRPWSVHPDDIDYVYTSTPPTFVSATLVQYETQLGTPNRGVWANQEVAIQHFQNITAQSALNTITAELDQTFAIMHHPNIVPILCACLNSDRPFIVMPLMRTHIAAFLKGFPMTDFSTRVGFVTGVLRGLSYLHDRAVPIVHGDIRCGTILYGFDGVVAISDVGLSRTIAMSSSTTRQNQTSQRVVRWIAPERLHSNYQPHTTSDMFSFGFTAYEILCGREPFNNNNMNADAVQEYVQRGMRPSRPAIFPDRLWRVVSEAWQSDLRLRPTAINATGILETLDRNGGMSPSVRVDVGTTHTHRPSPVAMSIHSMLSEGSSDNLVVSEAISDPIYATMYNTAPMASSPKLGLTLNSGAATTTVTTTATTAALHRHGVSGPISNEPRFMSDLATLVKSFPEWTTQIGISDKTILTKQHKLYITTNSAGKITKLRLGAKMIQGVISPHLANLSRLRVLDLYKNNLSGYIPPEIGNLTKLTELSLYQNDLCGEIPPELGRLANLIELNLSINNLSGPIPKEIGELTRLGKLNLYNNQLSGRIPYLGRLTSLTRLNLYSNQLAGPLPKEIGGLINLTELKINYNQFTGNIPPEIGNLSRLSVL
ncbi:hypothetical protein BSLG_004235 [Batrachochytrium salamandrivorans]|nr:hypothetical protein BSLG_004235 [Batrachochytrium salamandrivorans]